MAIVIIDGFQLNASKPIDYRIVASNSTARSAISFLYDGLKVFQQDNRKTYVWNSNTSIWDEDTANAGLTGSGATNSLAYFASSSSLAGSVIYQNSGNIGINAQLPLAGFQVNGNFLGSAQPITINVGSTAKIGYNWYNNGTDQTFNSSQGSVRIGFGNGDFSIDVRKANAANSSFKTPLFINSDGEPLLSSNSNITIKGSTVSITGTSSVSFVTKNIIAGYIGSSEMFRISSGGVTIGSTAFGGYGNIFPAGVTTTNATPTTLAFLNTQTGKTYVVQAYVIGKSALGATAMVGGFAKGVFRNDAGTLVQVGGNNENYSDFGGGTPSFSLNIVGTNVVVRVNGLSATSISWSCAITWYQA